MNKNYTNLVESINSRYNPDGIILEESIRNKLSSVSDSNLLTYLKTSMNEVDPNYTRKCKEAGEQAKNQLDQTLTEVSYEYQGSVMTDTHIKGNSDIDLLVISEKFYSIDSNNFRIIKESSSRLMQEYGQAPINKIIQEYDSPRYAGDALEVQKQLRFDSERKLVSVYTSCDCSKSKSIRLTNKNLHRDVDVVISNWYDDAQSVINSKGIYRGIQIYDKHAHTRSSPDFPFLRIELINKKSSTTQGRLKKMIRFLKNLKADSTHEINLSSFDISSICYSIDESEYSDKTYYQLVRVVLNRLSLLNDNNTERNSLKSVDGKEFIFKNNTEKKEGLDRLFLEVLMIYQDLNSKFNL